MSILDQNRIAASSRSARGGINRAEINRGWPLVVLVLCGLMLSGWAYLIAMVADMVPVMDMSDAGPGMALFNQFNLFKGLPTEARAALAVLCLPEAATFGMPGAAMGLWDLAKIFLMWAMMALAMMLPTAVPMLRAYHHDRSGSGQGVPDGPVATTAVMAGYILIWLIYAVAATLAQWGLSGLGAVSEMMAPVSLALTTSVLLTAGVYQFTPAKRACLARCWYPRWSFAGAETPLAAFREGLVQGGICLGCCWAVMSVMFAVGLMNVLWIALLGGVMALEKTVASRLFPIAIGVFLLGWGGLLAAGLVIGRPGP